MNQPPRVVLDTNVAVSALLFTRGRLAPLRQAWQAGQCKPLVSSGTAQELVRVLHYPKFRLAADDVREILAEYLPWCTTVRIPSPRPRVPACRDPDDQPFLELAVAGKAHFLVTGDLDLRALTGKLSCPIVTPDQFLAVLAEVRP
jgi:putative PIN family toxin of toxin-antitoxin system